MDSFDRHLMQLGLAIAIVSYAMLSLVAGLVTLPSEVSVIAGVPHTPVVLDFRLTLRGGRSMLAVNAELRQEDTGDSRQDLAERGSSIDGRPLHTALRQLESHGLLLSQWRDRETRERSFDWLALGWRAGLAPADR